MSRLTMSDVVVRGNRTAAVAKLVVMGYAKSRDVNHKHEAARIAAFLEQTTHRDTVIELITKLEDDLIVGKF